jgi:F-type H+-transporting ATPase subunit b
MSIDWFTLIAQIFNLLILLFLLRKFLYLPVLEAVEARQKLIREELKKAEDSRIKAQKAEEQCQQKISEIEREKQQILADVQRAAEKLKADLSEEAEHQYHQAQAEWKERLQSEQQNFDNALQKLAAEHFNRFAEKAMRQMADAELNELITEQFIAKIKSLPSNEKTQLKEGFQKQRKIVVQTAQPLSFELQQQIENVLRSECDIAENAKLQYEINPDIISGIVLQSGEYMTQWSLNSYLQEFKQTMAKEVSRLINKGA